VYVRYKLAGVALAALGTYGLWLGVLRALPLFQVENVTVTGLSSNAAPQISSTITRTAREMTTTDFSASRLRQAVSGYNAVATVNVHTHFPHGVVVQVVERRPIARLAAGGNMLAVSADGRVLAGLVPSHSLPLIAATSPPVEGRVSGSLVRDELALLTAAPPGLRAHVFAVRVANEGLTVRLRGGPLVYFGDALLVHAKWDATAAVLASRTSRGARYIDVSLPSRPAAAVDDQATIPPASTGPTTVTGASGTLPGSTSTSTSG
jgi:cell division septal protein FtsQ